MRYLAIALVLVLSSSVQGQMSDYQAHQQVVNTQRIADSLFWMEFNQRQESYFGPSSSLPSYQRTYRRTYYRPYYRQNYQRMYRNPVTNMYNPYRFMGRNGWRW